MLQKLRRNKKEEPEAAPVEVPASDFSVPASVEIEDHDPLMPFLLEAGGPVDLSGFELDSPAVDQLREAGVELVVPLVSQGELIGTLNLGHRLSDQPYSTDDQRLLGSLAAQVAPAIRVAQLVKEQEAEAEERQRIEQELKVATLIQQTLLPKDVPHLSGWDIDVFYRPAREVGGDFYDFIELEDGRIGLVIGDVTDKGVPAALVMATCRSMLRAVAAQTDDPGAVLAEVNDSLVEEIPPNMFVTCQYGILDPQTGDFTYANAGHNLPYVRTESGVVELRATGMPLGLMPQMNYEVKEARIQDNETMVLSSDGIVEAHDVDGNMYGFPRLMSQVATHGTSAGVIPRLVADLDGFVPDEAEQEDDITLVSVRRAMSARSSASAFRDQPATITEFSVPSEPGNERIAMDKVAEAVADLGLPDDRLEKLRTAVSEATMNAIEHGNQNRAELPVDIAVFADNGSVRVRVTDHGGSRGLEDDRDDPDIEAKLAGQQSPRGWGLFLIENMVDEMRTESDDQHHTIELVMNAEGAN